MMDVGTVVSILSIAGTILAIAVYVANLAFRFRKLEKQSEHRKEDSKIMLRSLLACLDGLQQQGANGAVTKAKEELSDYICNSR